MRPPLIRTDMWPPISRGPRPPPAGPGPPPPFPLSPAPPLFGAFLITPNCCEIFAVRLNEAGSMTPTPLDAGQTSALISFIIQAWWPRPSVGPFLSTSSVHSLALSRHQIQPANVAPRNLTAVAWLAALF